MAAQYNYNLVSPPRYVPWSVRIQVLFGGFSQLGWIFFGFGMVFFWIFGFNADWSSLYFSLTGFETTTGMVLEVEDTNASEGERPIYTNHYTYRIERLEREHQGLSYSSGRRFEPGQTVTIEYLKGNPTISRIQSTRRGMFSLWAFFITGAFPLVGLGVIIFGLAGGLKASHLLANGRVGLGVLKSKEPTNTRINNRTVYKLIFEFSTDGGGYYQVATKTHLPHKLQDDLEERLLYDPYNPTYAVMLDNLPGGPDIDEMGDLRPASLVPGLLVLILPALTVVGHGTVLLSLIL